ncbi:hypothetical protein NDU88_005891 [Pleurodeles waltl]|uniref:Uncharacterized protein n=1 Tax=Pleurodeles waltl TaxID=8319 RepID=A0AAV7SMY9_PLEWA|nr:hypothetical protein NDU88_005891 [Pleurodeles waltl]
MRDITRWARAEERVRMKEETRGLRRHPIAHLWFEVVDEQESLETVDDASSVTSTIIVNDELSPRDRNGGHTEWRLIVTTGLAAMTGDHGEPRLLLFPGSPTCKTTESQHQC